MIDRLRTPLFAAALVALALAFLVEIGAAGLLPRIEVEPIDLRAMMEGELADDLADLDEDDKEEALADLEALRGDTDPPGLGIPALVLLDVLFVVTAGLIALGLLIPERFHGRAQGVISLVAAFLVLVAAIAAALRAFGELILMLGLVAAVPFGTLTYLAIYGSFPRGAAAAVLITSLFLKLAFAVLLVLAHQRFLQNKGLVLLILLSLVGNLAISFLHGLVPVILVSITDAVAAIVNAILAIVWAIVMLIGAILAIVKALRIDRATAR